MNEFTKCPNELLDNALRECSGSAFVLLMYIVRKTIGWHKDSDKIANEQIILATSITSPKTIKKAREELVRKGYISVGKHGKYYHYRLRNMVNITINSGKDYHDGPQNMVNITNTKETIKKTKENYKYTPTKTTNGRITPSAAFEIAWQSACNADAEGLKNGDGRILTAVKQFGWARLRQWDVNYKTVAKREFMEIYNNVK